jgi:hypothetical protein
MPYDPRSVSQGGNRGIDESFSRSAPEGKYRVIGVDTFDGGDWLQGDFDTKEAALACARSKGGNMTIMHVYDDHGRHVGNAGTF